MVKILFPYGEICFECAKKLNPDIPKDQVMGIWPGICPVCKKKTSLADPSHDFNIVMVDKEKLDEITN